MQEQEATQQDVRRVIATRKANITLNSSVVFYHSDQNNPVKQPSCHPCYGDIMRVIDMTPVSGLEIVVYTLIDCNGVIYHSTIECIDDPYLPRRVQAQPEGQKEGGA